MSLNPFRKELGILTLRDVLSEDDIQKVIDALQVNKKGIKRMVIYIEKEKQRDDEIYASGYRNNKEVVGALEYAKNKIINDDLG